MRICRTIGGLVLCALLVSGCEGSGFADVAGTVMVDGIPVDAGSITFVPTDGQTPTAGGPIKDGRYSVPVPIGTMKVSISFPKVDRRKKLYATPDSPEGTMWKEGLPARYNEKTELVFEVKSGKNAKDWELTGR